MSNRRLAHCCAANMSDIVHSRGLLMGTYGRFIVLHARFTRKQAAFA